MGVSLITRDPKQLNLWAKRIASCKSSGKPVNIWCEENGIAPKNYYY